MDDLPADYKPVKKRNYKVIILIIAVVAIISYAALNSYMTKYVDEPADLHATIIGEVSLSGSGISANLLNDGVVNWDVDSVDVGGGGSSCGNLAKDVKPNTTARVRCTITEWEEGRSYPIVISVKNVDDESTFMVSGIGQYKP
tara:strand:+ start:48 stop:476 length:429 start_codon:yes stop_codon:yes gene_type:complete